MYNRNIEKQSDRNGMRTCERNRYERNFSVKGNCEKTETYFPKSLPIIYESEKEESDERNHNYNSMRTNAFNWH